MLSQSHRIVLLTLEAGGTLTVTPDEYKRGEYAIGVLTKAGGKAGEALSPRVFTNIKARRYLDAIIGGNGQDVQYVLSAVGRQALDAYRKYHKEYHRNMVARKHGEAPLITGLALVETPAAEPVAEPTADQGASRRFTIPGN